MIWKGWMLQYASDWRCDASRSCGGCGGWWGRSPPCRSVQLAGRVGDWGSAPDRCQERTPPSSDDHGPLNFHCWHDDDPVNPAATPVPPAARYCFHEEACQTTLMMGLCAVGPSQCIVYLPVGLDYWWQQKDQTHLVGSWGKTLYRFWVHLTWKKRK